MAADGFGCRPYPGTARLRDPPGMDAVRSIPTASARRRDLVASPALALFLALFASQSGVLVLSPILSDVADDFGVSIATAGQLRIVAAPLAAAVALLAARSLVRFSPRALPGAGILGMPLIGVVAEVDWRLAFLVLPLPAALLAGLAAAGRPHDAPLAA